MTPEQQLATAIAATRARLALLEQLRNDPPPTRADLGWMAVGLVLILAIGALYAAVFGPIA